MVVLAHQPEPRSEWIFPIAELQDTFTRFVDHSRHRQVLPLCVARANLYLAQLVFLHGDNRAAFQWVNQSIAVATEGNDRELAGLGKNTLACLYAATGDFPSALAAARASERDLRLVERPANARMRAIVLRNCGLLERAVGRNGTQSLQTAIEILEQCPDSTSIGISSAMLTDLRMTLCEMYWSQGQPQGAVQTCRQALHDLTTMSTHISDAASDKFVLARNRYANAIRFAERNRAALEDILSETDSRTDRATLAQTASRWQWQPLLDLKTELVSCDHWLSGTMPGEFEPQSAIVVPWSKFQWSHQAVREIAIRGCDRSQVVVLADSGASLEEAQASLHEAGLSLDRIRFGVADYESPWFRDDGPILSISGSGDMIWFDSWLTRDQRTDRAVCDTLPQVLRRDWRTRTAEIAIHIEGGMILSNGRGFTVCSRRILKLNRLYGFTDEAIVRDLRRVTGAKELIFVDTLIGEETAHVDLFMTFTDPTTVVVGEFEDSTNVNAAHLDHVADLLSKVVVESKPLTVVRVPMPEGNGLFPTFTNVVYVNGVLLVPSYSGDAQKLEPVVRGIYEKLLPDWQVDFIDCTRICAKGGGLHCLVSNLGATRFTPVFSPGP